MIEVMITMVILAVGLLGLAGLQARALTAEVEAYSRAQALVLLQDMADRIAANRSNSKLGSTSAYATSTVFGTGNADTNCSTLATGTAAEVAARDLCEWDKALKGAAQQSGGVNVGGIAGARGCIALETTPIRQFVVSIAWQGRGSFGSVPTSITCASAAISGSSRRVVSIKVPLPDLDS